jgi:mono/diheme cytochrome c family protein
MRRFLLFLLLLAALAGGLGWWLSRPQPPSDARLAEIAAHAPDPDNGEQVFYAAGCASCHAEEGAEGEARLVLAGGTRLESPYGTFVAPNISTDPTHGIGNWTQEDFAVALLAGVSPEGRHYYPSFPYTAYAKMTPENVADLWAFMQTLPASDRPNEPGEIGFPYSIRRGIGLWKQLYLTDDWVAAAPSETLERGRYIVEALAHCAECHTPRDGFGGLDVARWMGGAPNPAGRGRIPNITPAALDWSAEDIAYYLETGFTPDFDTVGGSMVSVVKNTAELTARDRAAIAAYVKGLAPVEPAETE